MRTRSFVVNAFLEVLDIRAWVRERAAVQGAPRSSREHSELFFSGFGNVVNIFSSEEKVAPSLIIFLDVFSYTFSIGASQIIFLEC